MGCESYLLEGTPPPLAFALFQKLPKVFAFPKRLESVAPNGPSQIGGYQMR